RLGGKPGVEIVGHLGGLDHGHGFLGHGQPRIDGVLPDRQRQGIGAQLVEEAHRRLRAAGETLSIVLGEPAYYGRFGYTHEDAAAFDSDYQCAALQAALWGATPTTGRLVYAPAFGGL
ncbi:GNAT family N-acetyltransferase, partial [Nitratireductor aquimarinus]